MNKKSKFNIENYTNKAVVVHCKTMKELKIFLDYLSSVDHPYPNYEENPDYVMCNMYNTYSSNLCVSINYGWNLGCLGFGPIKLYEKEKCDILEFSDFDWFTKYDIEDGMVVLTRRGTKYIKLDNCLINEIYRASLEDYDVDCRCRYSKDEDIMAVYSSKALCLS